MTIQSFPSDVTFDPSGCLPCVAEYAGEENSAPIPSCPEEERQSRDSSGSNRSPTLHSGKAVFSDRGVANSVPAAATSSQAANLAARADTHARAALSHVARQTT